MLPVSIECDYYRNDEDGIYCEYRQDRCRFTHRERCKDFEPWVDSEKYRVLK